MHWVDRGPEPDELENIRLSLTQSWIDHYRDGVGQRPNDAKWRDFRNALCVAFASLCAYCEETDRGEVDHFKPVSRFPSLVYEWSNWIFSCHNCNMNKSNKWPDNGYIDPCTEDESERPERFFDFNTANGEIIPKPDIPAWHQQKALTMINDLALNDSYHLKIRTYILRIARNFLYILDQDPEKAQENLSMIIDRTSPLSSIVRALLDDLGFDIDE